MLRELWIDHYGALLAGQLDPECRYSLIKIGAAEFAYTNYDGYVRALGQAWRAGLVPQSLGAVTGDRLLEIAPNLRGVDADLTSLQASDVERSSRFS
jgi:hypothetical protein